MDVKTKPSTYRCNHKSIPKCAINYKSQQPADEMWFEKVGLYSSSS